MTGSLIWLQWNSVFLRAQSWVRLFSTCTSPSELQCDCYQYADDTTFYIHSKPCDLDSSADHINKAVTSLRDYSESCSLALNSSKTNWMFISTPQMARDHSLEERKLPIVGDDTPLKRISCTKLLGVYVDQHLTWKTHVDHVLSSS